MLTKLIAIPSAFVGAFVIATIATSKGIFENSVVLTLDNGFKVTWVWIIACVVTLAVANMKVE